MRCDTYNYGIMIRYEGRQGYQSQALGIRVTREAYQTVHGIMHGACKLLKEKSGAIFMRSLLIWWRIVIDLFHSVYSAS